MPPSPRSRRPSASPAAEPAVPATTRRRRGRSRPAPEGRRADPVDLLCIAEYTLLQRETAVGRARPRPGHRSGTMGPEASPTLEQAGAALQLNDVGPYAEISRRPNPRSLVIVFMPSLVATLLRAEAKKGGGLTADEV